MLRKWEELPDFMKTPEVRPYWEVLWKRRFQLRIKRVFDFIFGVLLLVILAIPILIIALEIKVEDGGNVLFRQERVTAYGKRFRIHKFRTMVPDADKIGTLVTLDNDPRITRIGSKLRVLRLDELPQLLDVIRGDMSFVGTRPEAVKYVEKYENEWKATLLLPAGITSECSIRFKNEDKLLENTSNVDAIYMNTVLPEKMKINLNSLKKYNFFYEVGTMVRTVLAVLGKDY